MKKSLNLIIIFLFAFIGAVIIHYASLKISPALAFAIGALVCSVPLYYATSCSDHSQNSVTHVNYSSQTVYVGNLPYRANENDVKTLFSDYGEVFAVRLMKDKRTGKRKGFGFVVMGTDSAPRAIKNLNNSAYMDRTLKVREAKEPKTQGSV